MRNDHFVAKATFKDSLTRQKNSFKTLIKRDKSTSIRVKNLQHLATELFKVKNDPSPEIMKENETYNLRSGNHLAQKNTRTALHGTDSVSNSAAKLRNLLSGEIKSSSFLTISKN